MAVPAASSLSFLPFAVSFAGASGGGGGEKTCERHFYVMQDANYNVLGLMQEGGRLVERYEYTPYGERTVYSHGWSIYDVNNDGAVDSTDSAAIVAHYSDPHDSLYDVNGDGVVNGLDTNAITNNQRPGAEFAGPGVYYARLASHHDRTSTTGLAITPLCEVGHQGLFHDEDLPASGLIDNRARILHTRLARFNQRDLAGYVDSLSLYQYQLSRPTYVRDPSGLICPRNTCDSWYLTIDSALSGGMFSSAMGMIGSLEPMPVVCCMDKTASRGYSYGGYGIGWGLNFTMTFGSEKRCCHTSGCVSWEDHAGCGRATAIGVGIYYAAGHLIVSTPQTYQHCGGLAHGLDGSVVTTLGKWGFTGSSE